MRDGTPERRALQGVARAPAGIVLTPYFGNLPWKLRFLLNDRKQLRAAPNHVERKHRASILDRAAQVLAVAHRLAVYRHDDVARAQAVSCCRASGLD